MADTRTGIEKGMVGRVLSVRRAEGAKGAHMDAGIPRENQLVSIDALLARFPGSTMQVSGGTHRQGGARQLASRFTGGGNDTLHVAAATSGPGIGRTAIIMIGAAVVIVLLGPALLLLL